MNSLERARCFLAQKASRLALSAVPLAALALAAVPASAGVILSTGNDCSVIAGTGSCSTFQVAAGGGNSNMNWIAMTGSGLSSFNSGSGNYQLDFLASDSGSGHIPAGGIPIAWDFQFTAAVDHMAHWTLQFTLDFQDGNHNTETEHGSGTTGGPPITGLDVQTLAAGHNIVGWSIELDTTSNNSFGATIPTGSTVDYNTTAPEPSSLLLMSAGGALLLLRRKKKA